MDEVTPHDSPPPAPEDWFRGLWAQHAGVVLRYAAYRVGPVAAEDAVAETFAVAWRRRQAVPQDARPWLLGVARKVTANTLRTDARRPTERLSEGVEIEDSTIRLDERVSDEQDLLTALGALSEADRDLLILVAWHDLSSQQAAVAYGCSVTALNVRLHRARKRLRKVLEAQSDGPACNAALEVALTPTRTRKASR